MIIYRKTDDFDSNKIKLFINELFCFAEKVHIFVTEERKYDNEKSTEEFNHYLLGYLTSYSLKTATIQKQEKSLKTLPEPQSKWI